MLAVLQVPLQALDCGSHWSYMDNNDKQRMNAALINNNVGQPAYWHNNNSGAEYKVVLLKMQCKGNQYCREYRIVADIAGKKQQMYGTASST